VKAAADRLARERFLLPEDVVRTVERASASSIGRNATATRQ
jgi:hypothetical protein